MSDNESEAMRPFFQVLLVQCKKSQGLSYFFNVGEEVIAILKIQNVLILQM